MDFEKKWLYVNYGAPVAAHLDKVFLAAEAKGHLPFVQRLLLNQKKVRKNKKVAEVHMSNNPFRNPS